MTCSAAVSVIFRRASVSQPLHRCWICNGGYHAIFLESVAPIAETIPDHLPDASPIFSDYFQPCQRTHLRKIDHSETEARNKDVDAVTHLLVAQRVHGMLNGVWAIGMSPAVFD